jgi:hypothetical protein
MEGSFAELGQTAQSLFNDSLPLGTTTAEYFVIAANTSSQSAPSPTYKVVVGTPSNVSPFSAPAAPQSLRARTIRGFVLLQWQGAPSTTTFHIFRRLDTEIDFTAIGQTTQPLFNDRLPQMAGVTEYMVIAENQFGVSPESNIITVRP